MKIVGVTGVIALAALPLLACDRVPAAGMQSSHERSGHVAPSAKDAGLVTLWKDGGSMARWGGDAGYLAQFAGDAGYGMPNPQPGSPISPSYDAGIAPPAPSPSAPKVPNAPSPPAPLPGTPSASPSPTNP